jgi:hypothetical protein
MYHQVVDGGDGLQIWRITVIILNKQPWTADNGWSFSFHVGQGANNFSLYLKKKKKKKNKCDIAQGLGHSNESSHFIKGWRIS